MVYVGMNLLLYEPYYPGLMVLNSVLHQILLVHYNLQKMVCPPPTTRKFSMTYYLEELNQHLNSQNKLADSENKQPSVA